MSDLETARETIKRLNRRAQEAEAALADLKRCNEVIASGKAWCGGNLGRALLAWDNSRLREENESLRKINESLAERVAAQSDLLTKRAERPENPAERIEHDTPPAADHGG